jgi:putative phosphoribosyl transferase
MLFISQSDAGRELGASLLRYRDRPALVLALPRGGMPVAAEVARIIEAPLDAWVVSKVRSSAEPELVLGAVAEGGSVYLNGEALKGAGLGAEQVYELVTNAQQEVAQRAAFYRGGHPSPNLAGLDAIIVDDGVTTGGSARAAIQSIRARQPERVVFATPVGCARVIEALRGELDDLICLHPRRDASHVDVWYHKPHTVTEDEVRQLLHEARARRRSPRSPAQRDGVRSAFGTVDAPVGGV